MNIQILMSGGLEMSATKKEQRALKKLKFPNSRMAEREFIETYLLPLGYSEILPETVGALTSATLITDGKNVWGDMDYQVKSFITDLANGNTVYWTKG